MKLKYYMRGLGIGIVLTTLIFAIANPKEKLTDKEIKDRASALGMVMKEDDNSDLENMLNNLNVSVTPSPTATSDAPSTAPTLEPTIEPTLAPTSAPVNTPVPTKAPVQQETKVAFTIKSGMSSGQVSKLLEEKGLIKDADDFNLYIVKKGKASSIRVGKYSISSDASYDAIIKMITTKK